MRQHPPAFLEAAAEGRTGLLHKRGAVSLPDPDDTRVCLRRWHGVTLLARAPTWPPLSPSRGR